MLGYQSDWGMMVRRLILIMEEAMTNRVYKKIEVVGTSPESIEHAIENAVAAASKSMRNLDWFEVSEIRGHIKDGVVDHYQVVTKIGFRLE